MSNDIMSLVINMLITPLSIDSQDIALLSICAYVPYVGWLRAGGLFLVYSMSVIGRYVATFHKILGNVIQRCAVIGRAPRVGHRVCKQLFKIPDTQPQNQKTIVGSPYRGGIGIVIPSSHISPSGLWSEFFSSGLSQKFFSSQVFSKIFYWKGGGVILRGDSGRMPLGDGVVNCVVTSPPYWSLRKYAIPDLVWDGVEGCEHEWVDSTYIRNNDMTAGEKQRTNTGSVGRDEPIKNAFCLHCSAWRGQLGLEPTIDLYLKHLLQVMDECKRVLRDDGTMWVNLGDSYSAESTHASKAGATYYDGISGTYGKDSGRDVRSEHKRFNSKQIPQKSMCLIPERFAIEMVNRGWILRNKLVWHKPNCMPSSAKDRFTVDFEPVFFFVKSKKYWFEQQYEPFKESYIATLDYKRKSKKAETGINAGLTPDRQFKAFQKAKTMPGRNTRCVWTISTQSYSESHFATFPEALVEPMIKAGCPKEICVKCGKAREKIVEVKRPEPTHAYKKQGVYNTGVYRASRTGYLGVHDGKPTITEIGLTDCGCNTGWRSGVVLDPFAGSGTVLRVAEKLGRQAIGIDLGYQEMAQKRVENNQKVMFA